MARADLERVHRAYARVREAKRELDLGRREYWEVVRSERAQGRTLASIAAELGVSRERAAQICAPAKHRARQIAYAAIVRGDLVRGPCEECGSEPTQAHHDDYSKPLEVRWLCKPHHEEHHKVERVRQLIDKRGRPE